MRDKVNLAVGTFEEHIGTASCFVLTMGDHPGCVGFEFGDVIAMAQIGSPGDREKTSGPLREPWGARTIPDRCRCTSQDQHLTF